MSNCIMLCSNGSNVGTYSFINYRNDILIKLITSALAGFLALFLIAYISVIKQIVYIKEMTGKWLSYAFSNEFGFDKNNMPGEIEISKTGNYTLHLKYSEKNTPHIWEGDIFMNKEFTKIGKVCWRYVVLHGRPTTSTTISGFKDIVIEINKKYGFTLRLLGEREKGYGDELLIRKYID